MYHCGAAGVRFFPTMSFSQGSMAVWDRLLADQGGEALAVCLRPLDMLFSGLDIGGRAVLPQEWDDGHRVPIARAQGQYRGTSPGDGEPRESPNPAWPCEKCMANACAA